MLQIFLYAEATFDHVKCKCECIPKNPQKIPRKEGGGRVEDCLRLFQKIPPFL